MSPRVRRKRKARGKPCLTAHKQRCSDAENGMGNKGREGMGCATKKNEHKRQMQARERVNQTDI